MATAETDTISKILLEADILTPLDMGITHEHFQIPDAKQAWMWLLKSWRSGGSSKMPSPERFLRSFPDFDYNEPPDPLDTLCLELVQKLTRAKVSQLCEEAVENLSVPGHDPIDTLIGLQTDITAYSASLSTMSVINVAASVAEVMQQYEEAESGDGVIGIPWPWPYLNKATGGMIPGRFLLFYGRPKSGKTFCAVHCAVNAYWKHNATVLFYTREMTPAEIRKRVVAGIAEVPYRGSKGGRLSKADKVRFFDTLTSMEEVEKTAKEELGKRQRFLVVSDRGVRSGGGGVSSIRAYVEKFRPDVLVVDGVYLLKDDRTNTKSVKWDNLANVVADLKDLAMDFEIPVIGTTQENREGGKSKEKDASGIAFADAFGMWVDMACNVTMKAAQGGGEELWLRFPAVRDDQIEGFVIGFRPMEDFRYRRALKRHLESGDDEKKGSRQL